MRFQSIKAGAEQTTKNCGEGLAVIAGNDNPVKLQTNRRQGFNHHCAPAHCEPVNDYWASGCPSFGRRSWGVAVGGAPPSTSYITIDSFE